MPITITENAGLRKIEVLAQKVSDQSMHDLCVTLADSLIEELHTVPWGGNIKRGLTHMSAPKRTSTGGWAIGIGSLGILHRDPAPQGTISEFLQWYRSTAEERKKQTAAQKARGAKAKRAEKLRVTMRAYRRTTFEQLRIERARAAGKITRKMALRDEAINKEFYAIEAKLDEMMSGAEYRRYTARYERIIEAEEIWRKRKYGRR